MCSPNSPLLNTKHEKFVCTNVEMRAPTFDGGNVNTLVNTAASYISGHISRMQCLSPLKYQTSNSCFTNPEEHAFEYFAFYMLKRKSQVEMRALVRSANQAMKIRVIFANLIKEDGFIRLFFQKSTKSLIEVFPVRDCYVTATFGSRVSTPELVEILTLSR